MSNTENSRLTGDQVKFIRTILGESQEKFALRIDVSQPVIVRMEKKKDETISGPESILIRQIAANNKIMIPDSPLEREKLQADEESTD